MLQLLHCLYIQPPVGLVQIASMISIMIHDQHLAKIYMDIVVFDFVRISKSYENITNMDLG